RFRDIADADAESARAADALERTTTALRLARTGHDALDGTRVARLAGVRPLCGGRGDVFHVAAVLRLALGRALPGAPYPEHRPVRRVAAAEQLDGHPAVHGP